MAIGPRIRRRLVAGGIVVGAIAAIAGAVLLTQSPAHSGATAGRSNRHGASASTGRAVAFGMTGRQVRRLTGPPTAARGRCWLFRPQNGMVGSISMGQPGSIAARSTGDLELCFYGGVLSSAFRHIYEEGRWQWNVWNP
jgi:hypothetical protein